MKDGSKSEFQLFRLASTYRKMKEDGRLLSNRATVELLDARIVQLLERIDQNEAPDRFVKIYNLWKRRRRESNDLKRYDLDVQIDELMEAGFHDYAAWQQTFEALDLRRKLVESEVKVVKDLKAMMTMEDAYEMIAKVTAIILEIENDPNKLKRYRYELIKLTGDDRLRERDLDEQEALDVQSQPAE